MTIALVYQIGRDFRNEGVSFKHNPEFTQLEFYEAYADYQDVMRRTEEMVAYVAQQVNGGLTLTWQEHTVDLTPPCVAFRCARRFWTPPASTTRPSRRRILGRRNAQPLPRTRPTQFVGQIGGQPDGKGLELKCLFQLTFLTTIPRCQPAGQRRAR